ncbi:MAG: oligosaccharide flippase family protein [Anaerolineales bacterium]|nr:oligosaccharide flippase family protein [Anaerolineales bacterium]
MESKPLTGPRLAGGTLQVFVAEALVLPTGFLTAAFLTRRLGPEGYGLLALASSLIAWLEWSLASILARAVVKFVAEADDWRPVATASLRAHFGLGLALAALVWLVAPAAAAVLGEPALAGYLRLFALDLPLFSLAHAHRQVLTGRGDFGGRALAAGARWVTRLFVVVLLVSLGLAVEGAILGSVTASAVELVLARRRAPIPWRRGGAPFAARRLWGFALPIVLMALSLRLFDKLDLFVLKARGATAAEAGLYGAAQNLAWLPGLFALSFSPLLLATLTRLRREGDRAGAARLARQALRGALWLLPPAALVVGGAPDLLRLAYGPAFAASAIVLGPLVLGGVALVLVSVSTAILTAGGRPELTFALTGPLVPLALAGVWLVAPRGGLLGAALVSGALALVSAGVCLWAVAREWGVRPARATAARVALLTAGAFAFGLWPTPGLWLLPKLAAGIGALVPAALALGELAPAELAWLRQRLGAALRPEQGQAVVPAKTDG